MRITSSSLAPTVNGRLAARSWLSAFGARSCARAALRPPLPSHIALKRSAVHAEDMSCGRRIAVAGVEDSRDVPVGHSLQNDVGGAVDREIREGEVLASLSTSTTHLETVSTCDTAPHALPCVRGLEGSRILRLRRGSFRCSSASAPSLSALAPVLVRIEQELRERARRVGCKTCMARAEPLNPTFMAMAGPVQPA